MEPFESRRECPVCGIDLGRPPQRRAGQDAFYYDCRRCGQFGLTRSALHALTALDLSNDPKGDKGPAFMHALRRMQIGNDAPLLTSELTKRVIETSTLPSVQ